MACPETSEKEWVELYNPDSQSYQLVNWKLKDSVGNTRLLNGSINAQSFAAFDLSSSMLNNDGDSISLETPSGGQLFSDTFGQCQKGHSFVYYDDAWQETVTVTKGTPNIYVSVDANDDKNQTLPFVTVDGTTTNFKAATGSSQQSSQSQQPQLVAGLQTGAASISSQFYPFQPDDTTLLQASRSAADPSFSSPSPSTAQETNHGLLSASLGNIPRVAILAVFFFSAAVVLGSGFGMYKWYTERHDEEDSGLP
jgi:hypothetical protein